MNRCTFITVIIAFLGSTVLAQSGRVGIGTVDPMARLHVQDSSVLFTGTLDNANPAPLPISGMGTRLMWYPDKAAFRAGYVDSSQWDLENIGVSSVAMGHRTTASGIRSTAFGSNSKATAIGATAMGSYAFATNHAATAFGGVTEASARYSGAIGHYLKADSYSVFVVGQSNRGGGDPEQWVQTDPIFEVGIGTSDSANAMTIYKNGGALWEGIFDPVALEPDPPAVEGPGTRMVWYPAAAAFRAGRVTGDFWDQQNMGFYSFAAGLNPNASGAYSMAMGYQTKASGSYSMAVGDQTLASGYNTMAFGTRTTASGIRTTSFGYQTKAESMYGIASGRYNVGGGTSGNWIATDPIFEIGIGTDTLNRKNAMTVFKNAGALWEGEYRSSTPDPPPTEGAGTRMMWYPDKAAFRAGRVTGTAWNLNYIGDYSVAMGVNSRAAGLGSISLGQGTNASGENATAIGYYSDATGIISTALGAGEATGDYSTAMGAGEATGDYSTAMGRTTSATGRASTALGNYTDANAYCSLAIGLLNVGGGNPTTWVSTDPIFEVGIGGPSQSVKKNAMTVLKNGNTGIGTNVPGDHRLYVNSSGTGSSGSTGYFRNTASTGIAMSIQNYSSSSTDNVLLVSNFGSVGDIASFDSWQGTNSWNRRFRFTNDGDGRCDGSWVSGGADYAEFFPLANPQESVEPGDVISMSESIGYTVGKSHPGKRQLILGVYSTNPAIVGNSSAEQDPENDVLVGLLGVVPTKVCTENGAIQIGDYVSSSSLPGVAAKAISSGVIIGRAMEDYNGTKPGLIKVIVDVGWVGIDDGAETENLKDRIEILEALVDQIRHDKSQ